MQKLLELLLAPWVSLASCPTVLPQQFFFRVPATAPQPPGSWLDLGSWDEVGGFSQSEPRGGSPARAPHTVLVAWKPVLGMPGVCGFLGLWPVSQPSRVASWVALWGTLDDGV